MEVYMKTTALFRGPREPQTFAKLIGFTFCIVAYLRSFFFLLNMNKHDIEQKELQEWDTLCLTRNHLTILTVIPWASLEGWVDSELIAMFLWNMHIECYLCCRCPSDTGVWTWLLFNRKGVKGETKSIACHLFSFAKKLNLPPSKSVPHSPMGELDKGSLDAGPVRSERHGRLTAHQSHLETGMASASQRNLNM